MRCTLLFALLLGELAVCSHAIQNFREGASRVGASKAEAARAELSRTEVEKATMEATLESSMDSSMELAFRASTLASMELSYTSEAAFRAYALAHTSMFGHSTYDVDDMIVGHDSSAVVEGSEKSDVELEAAEGSRSTAVEGSGELGTEGEGDGDAAGAEDNSEGQGRVDDDSQAKGRDHGSLGTTLSPDQRAMAHGMKFDAEFVVELNMTEAHETGERMGIVLNREADFMAATVFRIHKFGMVEDWNKRNPDKAVHVGDEVVRVNDIQWHANTETFITRIVGQFQSARSQTAGSKDTLRLYVQRPRIWEHKAFIGQRWDAHKKAYPTEFIATISMADRLDGTMEKEMGWQLERQHGSEGLQEWKPVAVKYINRLGNVEAWNIKHPDQLIIEGDEIVQLDNIKFQSNATMWLKYLQKHYRSATQVRNSNRSAQVYIRRPAALQKEFDETHPIKEIVTWKRPKHHVQIRFPQTTGDPTHLLGWQMVAGEQHDSGTSAIVIKKVVPGSLTDLINEYLNSTAIAAGDLIVGVNGVDWEVFDKASDFYAVVDEALKEAGKLGPDAEPVDLVLERPERDSRKVRLNMGRGVHMDPKMIRHFKEMRSTTTTEPPPKFGKRWDDPTRATDAAEKDTHDDEPVTGASEDDDNDVAGASEDEPTGGGEDSPDGAKDAKEDSEDDAP